MSIFYPSCTVALGFRWDENFRLAQSVPRPPQGTIQGPVQPGGAPLLQPVFLQQASDPLSWVVNVVPRSASITKPGFQKAGTFNLTFSFPQLPIDPMLVKAAQVRVFLGCVSEDDFSTGVTVIEKDVSGQPGRRSVLISHDRNGEPLYDRLAIWGVVDKWKVDFDEHDSVVHIEGRDLRGIFLESPIDPKTIKQVKLDQPIDQVIRDILKTHPLADKMSIKVQPADWTAPGSIGPASLPSPVAGGSCIRPRQGVSGNQTQNHPPEQNTKLTYWDLCCRYCFLVGAIPFFRGVDLYIRPVQRLYDLIDNAGVDPNLKTPFLGGKVRFLNGQPYAVRQMVYGANLKKIDFERKYVGGMRPRVIEVIGVDVSSGKRGKGKTVVVYYPQDIYKKLIAAHRAKSAGAGSAHGGAAPSHATKASPSGELSENEVYRYPVPGITDKAQLTQIGAAIFDSICRYEVEGHFTTKTLASLGGSNADPDIVRLEPGDPVEFSVFPQALGTRGGDTLASKIVSSQTSSAGKSFYEQIAETQKLVGSRDLAAAIVATRNPESINETQRIYRVHDAHFKWDKQSGIEVSGDVHNYIRAEYDDLTRPPRKLQPLKTQTVSYEAPNAPPPGADITQEIDWIGGKSGKDQS